MVRRNEDKANPVQIGKKEHEFWVTSSRYAGRMDKSSSWVRDRSVELICPVVDIGGVEILEDNWFVVDFVVSDTIQRG